MNSEGKEEQGAQSEQFADVRRHVPFLAKHEGVARLLERLLCYPKIRQAFAEGSRAENPMAGVTECLELGTRIISLEEQLPKTGPVVVVCNHSHGGADALALMAGVMKIRKDFKVLANRETILLDGLEPLVFPVSILESDKAAENVASIRAMLKHVRRGGVVGVFPAGRVALWKGDRMSDPAWSEQVVKLLQRMEATVVPVWFFGNPPPLINFLSRLSGFVRTALIPTGLAKMKGQEVVGRAGDSFESKKLKELGEGAGPWLRKRLESLSDLGN